VRQKKSGQKEKRLPMQLEHLFSLPLLLSV
jgi:hypothetical protein